MTAPYKKRAKSGWSCGKGHKGSSNRAERSYDCVDIKDQQLEVSKVGAKSKVKHKNDKKEKEIARLLSNLRFCHRLLSRGTNTKIFQVESFDGDFMSGIRQQYYQEYKAGIPKLKEYLHMNLKPKIRRQIEEVLTLFGESE